MAETKEKLDRLRAKRGGHRGVCTKLIITKETDEIVHATVIDYDRCEVIRALLEEKSKILNDIDEEILGICEVANIGAEIEESTEVMARILDAKRKLDKAKLNTKDTGATNISMATISNENGTNTTGNIATTSENLSEVTNTEGGNGSGLNDSNMGAAGTSGQEQISVSSLKPKLPKLTLPKFKGQVTKWGSFWDSYSSAIHDNKEISKIDKFNYLNSLLEGAALRAIQGLALTRANYDSAIEILKERFGKPQQIITAHMDEILKIPLSTDRLSSLRFVYDSLSVHVRGLQSVGISSDQYGSLLIPIIMAKLPNDVRLAIARKASSNVWKIDELLNTIKFEVEAREASGTAKTSTSAYALRAQVGNRGNVKDPSTASALFTAQGDMKGRMQCVYCGEHHYSASCIKVKNIDERKGILRRDRRCFVCLQRGHRAKECNKANNCRKCHGSHHQSICSIIQSKNESKDKPADQNFEGAAAKSEESLLQPEQVTSTTANTRHRTTHVLLQAATVYAVNPENFRKIKVRVLFDSGSQ